MGAIPGSRSSGVGSCKSKALCRSLPAGSPHRLGRAGRELWTSPRFTRPCRAAGAVVTGSVVPRPLLVIDGDSFAHRAYHALPKSIRRKDGKGAGAILGFANILLRLYEQEQARAVLVGWDTLDAPTYRSELFPPYQS